MLRLSFNKILHRNCSSYFWHCSNKQFSCCNATLVKSSFSNNDNNPSVQLTAFSHKFVRSFQHDASKNALSEGISDMDTTNSIQSQPIVNSGQSLADYGLGGWSYPHHWLQNIMDYLHLNLDIGWMPTIAIVTVALRFLAIPTYIKMRQFNTRTSNHLPEQTELQMRIMMATNVIEKKKLRMEYMEFLKKNNLNPFKPLLFSIPLSAIFLSFFAALRGIVAANVPSFVNGGMLWFTNLTVPDPYYILPLLSCLSLHILIRFGAATAEVGPVESIPMLQKILFWSPFALFPFAIFQPACMFVFWMTSNAFSLFLMCLFLNPKMTELCGIPKRVVHPPSVTERIKLGTLSFKKAKDMAQIRQQALNKAQNHIDLMNKHSQDVKKKQPDNID